MAYNGRVMVPAIAVLAAALAAPLAHADVDVGGTSYGTSVLVDITSGSDPGITQLRMWFSGNTFESCKTMAGWTCVYDENQVVFSADEPLDDGESARLSLVTAEPASAITWKALAGTEEVGMGVLQPGAPDPAPEPVTRADPAPEPVTRADPEPQPDPEFRIIPEKPNIGSTIRVVGESLRPAADFDFYINGDMLGTFTSGADGYFAGTSRIPADVIPGRAEFMLDGDPPLSFSIRLDHPGGLAPVATSFTLKQTPDVMNRGDSADLRGTGVPGTRVIVEVREPDGTLWTSLVAITNDDGAWSAGTVRLDFDAPFGRYDLHASDGQTALRSSWDVVSDRVMSIEADRTILEPGDVISFTGTALPNERIQLAIENPDGNKIGTEVLITDDSGGFRYEYRTTADSAPGPYTLIAIQAGQIEFVHTSIGPAPRFDFNLELDKNTYERGETMLIHMSGDKSDTLDLTILGERGLLSSIKHETQVTLDPEGRGLHRIQLGGNYSEGTYTARLSKGNIADEEKFGVDLERKSADLVIGPVKSEYSRGDSMLILGSTLDASGNCGGTVKNIEIVIRLVDPLERVVRSKSTFIDDNCSVIDHSFKVPDDAVLGTWAIVSNIKKEVIALRAGTDKFVNKTSTPGTATGGSYEGCVPATDLGKLVLLACKTDVKGPNPVPILRLVDKDGNKVWEGKTTLVNDIFDVLNTTTGIIQREPEPAGPDPIMVDFECTDKNVPSPAERDASGSNNTKIDLLGIKTISCPHGTEFYIDPLPVCTGGYEGSSALRHNATSVDTGIVGSQTVVYTCDDGWGDRVSATRTVIIVDTEPPELQLLGLLVDEHMLNNRYVELGHVCTDAADERPRVSSTADLLNIGKLGEHRIIYTCTDASGNQDSAIRTVNILDPCDIQSYANVRGEIGRNVLGCSKGNSGAGGVGATLIESTFEVVDADVELGISAADGGSAGTSSLVEVIVSGSKKGAVIHITYEDGTPIQEYTILDGASEITYHWLVERHAEPGTYTISATYLDQRAETTYWVPP